MTPRRKPHHCPPPSAHTWALRRQSPLPLQSPPQTSQTRQGRSPNPPHCVTSAQEWLSHQHDHRELFRSHFLPGVCCCCCCPVHSVDVSYFFQCGRILSLYPPGAREVHTWDASPSSNRVAKKSPNRSPGFEDCV